MDVDCMRQIKLWILEHACKHRMELVIKTAFQDKDAMELLYPNADIMQGDCSSIEPTYMLLFLLKNLLHSLNTSKKKKKDNHLCWNRSILSLVTEILSTSYQQDESFSFKHFTNLIAILKLMDLLRLLAEDVQSSVIVQKLNILFPRWNATHQTNIQNLFNIKDQEALNKMQRSHVQFRRFILRLTVSEACRANYLSQSYSKDLIKFITDATVYLNKVIIAFERKARPSMIEKLQKGDDDNLSYSDNPAIQILLEYIQPGVTEKDIISLLHALDPSAESQPNYGFACLDSLDILSDAGSEQHFDEGSPDQELLSDEMAEENEIVSDIDTISEDFDIIAVNPKYKELSMTKMLAGNSGAFIPQKGENVEVITDSEDEVIFVENVQHHLYN